jgi:hypothetical protein
MRKNLGKKLVFALAAVVVVLALSASVAFAIPVLQPGQTSAPGMSGNCASCHKYAAPKAPTLFSRPFLKAAKIKRGRTFNPAGYIAPTLCSATDATVTIHVQRRNARGKWVAVGSLTTSATVSPTGKYAGKVNYGASMKIKRLGKYRLRAKLAYLDADRVSHIKWSTWTTVQIKK